MKKAFIGDLIFVALCAVVVLALGVGIYALPMERISEEENRALANTPTFGIKKLLDGELFEELSDFYSDRIPLRTQMIRLKAVCELSLGKSENNGVRFEYGRLVDRCLYDDLDTLEENLANIKAFSARTQAVCAIVPRSADVYTDSEEAAAVRSLLDDDALYSRLCAVGDDAYYKTDHHLDAAGAFAVYEYVMESLGETPLPKSEFKLTQVSDDFLGSVYSRSGLIPIYQDTVSAWRYDGDTELSVKCRDTGCSIDGLYSPSALEGKDKYLYFLGGNHGSLSISSPTEERPCLYLIKDSFANSVIPLLARHFDLTVYDPRYSVSAPDVPDGARIVILCGFDTLATTGRFTRKLDWRQDFLSELS